MMTKKDFIALADELRPVLTVEHVGADGARTLGPSKIVDALAGFCRGQNPNFNEKRWRAYLTGDCGPSGGGFDAARPMTTARERREMRGA